MEFKLLGTVSVMSEGAEIPIGPVKRRSVLAALLLRANSAVPMSRLIDAVWEEEPPASARTVIQGHVSRLRALFDEYAAADHGVELATHGQAYKLRVPQPLLDVFRFEELVQGARGHKHPADAVPMFRQALGLWRGPALTGTVASAPLTVAAHALEETRIAVVEHLAAAYGRLGDHVAATTLLRAESVAHPLRESLVAALMLALNRSGRQSEAMECYHRTRAHLGEELGVDPGPELRAAYEALLRGVRPTEQILPLHEGSAVRSRQPGGPCGAGLLMDGPVTASTEGVAMERASDPAAAEDASGPLTVALPAPDLLPRAPRGFVGRAPEFAALDAAVEAARLALVTGPAGVGKTALALHWAHERAAAYPDGVLYADLRGFSPHDGVEPCDVLREFLSALGVPSCRIPESPTAAAALYRSVTANLALLVVLDNVRSADLARPLLPAGPDSAGLVTSRLRLGGLVVTELARPVPLDVLGVDASTAVLATAVGDTRVDAEPSAARRLAALCDGLPLALRVTAAQLAVRPHWRLSDLATELADEQRRLALLSVDGSEGAGAQGVAAALHLTVERLPEEAARLFRQLGVLPGRDLDRHAAAALLDRAPTVAAEALDRLCDAHLLSEYAPGRHTLHDLVRLYTRGLGADDDALLRLLDHYTLTALAAARAAEPDDQPCCTMPSNARLPRGGAPLFAGRDSALLWYAAERDNLAAAVAAARAAGHHDRAWRLGILQWPYILWNAHDCWAPLLEDAVDSAARVSDPGAESKARALIGWVLTQENRLPEALVHLRLAPSLAAQAGEVSSEATALVNLAVALDRFDVSEESLAHTARAAALVRGTGDVMTELLALEHRARQLIAVGDHSGALICAREGLALDGDTVNGLVGIRQSMLAATAGAALMALGKTVAGKAMLARARQLASAHGYEEGVRRVEAVLQQTGDTSAA
ncbi:AfsR/SARP family transcriptional regulator [Streptomyces luteolifulvus]|uniref:AfsR/SARP family transcriptional regulator n=1 Tax=Streptomyces luteolifulvus TaxID=2615112 RepID=UPI001CD9B55A|nr:AfsR/SARP family transcriptional regulator [Streptomyces luteolifulvus]